MDIDFTSREIQQKYERIAPCYDLMVALPEWLGFRKLRRRLLQKAEGRVLEVAVGTGRNLPYYPGEARLTAVDLSFPMISIARDHAERWRDVSFLIMDGGSLAFKDDSFDTVVSSLTLCTFPDPIGALREMNRVCRKEGRILLLEHGRSDREWLGRRQDKRAPRHARRLACHWNREPRQLVEEAGLAPVSAVRTFLGIIHLIEIRCDRSP
jgi:ubiquinone/menaquinone biosynthesis C-methylase UbiE